MFAKTLTNEMKMKTKLWQYYVKKKTKKKLHVIREWNEIESQQDDDSLLSKLKINVYYGQKSTSICNGVLENKGARARETENSFVVRGN